MAKEKKGSLESPYEKWAQRQAPIWPLLKYRLELAVFGAVAGLLLGALTFGLVWLIKPTQELMWNWSWLGFVVAGVTFSALIQNWHK